MVKHRAVSFFDVGLHAQTQSALRNKVLIVIVLFPLKQTLKSPERQLKR